MRLRAALPEALFAGSVGQALGRRTGLSVNGLSETQDENFAALSELLANFSCFGAPRSRIPDLDFGAEVDRLAADYKAKGIKAGRLGRHDDALRRDGTLDTAPEPMSPPLENESALPRSPEALAEEMVGTALVLAFCANTKVLPVVELARRLSDARARFRGAKLAAVDHDFDALHAMFLVMLSPGNLSSREEWLETSRLWRFILLQRSDGSWDSSQSLAFALQAHEGARPPPPPEPRSVLRRVLGALFGDDDLDDALDDAIDEALISSDDEDAEDAKARAAAAATPLTEVKDCPLSFSCAAIRRRLPPALAALNAEEKKKGSQAELPTLAEEPVAAVRASKPAPITAAAPLASSRHFAVATISGDRPTSPCEPELGVAGSALKALRRELDDLRAFVFFDPAEKAAAAERLALSASSPPGRSLSSSLEPPASVVNAFKAIQREVADLRAFVMFDPARKGSADDHLTTSPPGSPPGRSFSLAMEAAAPAPAVLKALQHEVSELRSFLMFDPAKAAVAERRLASATVSPPVRIQSRAHDRAARAAAPASDAGTSRTAETASTTMCILRRRLRLRPQLPLERIWATVLALSVLEELDACWLIDDEAEVVRTVVDAGRAFLHAQGRANKRLRPLLKREGRLRKAAELARRDWKAIQGYHVGQLCVPFAASSILHARADARAFIFASRSRDADVINKFTALTHLQRASARVVRSLCTDHSTFAAFLDMDGYIMRWQRLMILVTLVLSTLLTSIWFYYSRGANCCAELRTILECDPVGPCHGYTADCADLQAQVRPPL